MAKIQIADISLRESEQSASAKLSFKEKLEIVKLLEKLQIDVIETGPVTDAPADAAFIRNLATTITSGTISVPVALGGEDAERAWAALSKAKKPRLNVIAPVSTVQMEYMHGMKAEAVQKSVAAVTARCAALCPEVEFTAEDAARAEPAFLASVIKAAIEAGAKIVTLCDAAGELLPEEITGFIASVYENVPELRGVTLSLHLKDSLGLASAAALSGTRAGAAQIKTSFSPVSGSLSTEQFLNVIKVRGETLGIESGVAVTALQRTCRQIEALIGSARSGSSAFIRAVSGGDDLPAPDLSPETDIGTLAEHIRTMGYDITEGDLDRVYAQFVETARSKKVDNRDIEAIIAETAGQEAAAYELVGYVTNSGSAITASAVVEISKEGETRRGISIGDGPIDAAFLATEQVLGRHFELEDFVIQAVTEGREAMGSALVKLRNGGKLYSGRGLSTDIIGASIKAYLSAVNKIVYEERTQ